MSQQFIFFCVNVGNENLLKEEVKHFYPELNLSYSRRGFLTYKNLGVQYDPVTISQLDATFATRVGICLGKAKPEELLSTLYQNIKEYNLELNRCLIHSFSVNTDYRLEAEELFEKSVNGYSAHGKTVLDIIALGEKEIWFGVHTVAEGTTRYPNSLTEILVPNDVPSKAYLKLAQIVELYGIKFDKNDGWLDFGSCPGGASSYLLSKGCKVWGVDPAQMTGSVADHKNYQHISTAVQDLSQERLPDGEISWIHVDLNLKPTQAIKEVLRLLKKYSFALKGILFTVQLPNIDYVKNIEDFEDQFYDWGFSDISSVQVPSHKNEYVIIGRIQK